MLKEKLEEVKAELSSLVPSEIARKFDDFVKQLSEEGIEKRVIKVGDLLPDFKLLTSNGNEVTKNDFKGKKLAINFFRGSWWGYCNIELGVLEEIADEVKELSGALIAVSSEKISKHKDEVVDSVLPIFSDVGSEFAKELGLVFELPDEVYEIYKNLDIDIEKINGNKEHILPLPAMIIVDEQGIVRYVFAKVDHSLRAEPKEVLKVLKEI